MRALVLRQSPVPVPPDQAYSFRSGHETIRWPMKDGVGLGPTGAWNLLFRQGLQPSWISEGRRETPSTGDLLFAIAEGDSLGIKATATVEHWLSHGGTVVAGGVLPAWKAFFPGDCLFEQGRSEYPYAALGWVVENGGPEVVAPPLWPFGRVLRGKGVETFGQMVALRGERQTPARAIVTPLEEAPAVIRHGTLVYLNGNPFAAFQAWLQGQEDLLPWLNWRHRLFWLDELAAFLWKTLKAVVPHSETLVPQPLVGLPDTVVVLRHDLDHSRDTCYLQAEQAAGMAGVHAILQDRNAAFWVDVLKRAPEQEAAFHYSTGRYHRWWEWLRSKFGWAKRSIRPALWKIAGDGLLRQVRWAKSQGIGISTLHRHLSFLFYPEWIDAMAVVQREFTEVQGGSSLFRGMVLRWGSDGSAGEAGTVAEFPDPQFPYWFPFKLAHAGKSGEPLRGWETVSIMEVEPELFEQMLDHKVPGLRHRVLTVNFHPAHARGTTFCRAGSLPWFKQILGIIKARQVVVKKLDDVYAACTMAVSSPRGYL